MNKRNSLTRAFGKGTNTRLAKKLALKPWCIDAQTLGREGDNVVKLASVGEHPTVDAFEGFCSLSALRLVTN